MILVTISLIPNTAYHATQKIGNPIINNKLTTIDNLKKVSINIFVTLFLTFNMTSRNRTAIEFVLSFYKN